MCNSPRSADTLLREVKNHIIQGTTLAFNGQRQRYIKILSPLEK